LPWHEHMVLGWSLLYVFRIIIRIYECKGLQYNIHKTYDVVKYLKLFTRQIVMIVLGAKIYTCVEYNEITGYLQQDFATNNRIW
jgi:hypothetical protein